MEYQVFLFASLCSFICLQTVYQDLCASLLGVTVQTEVKRGVAT